EAKLLNNLVHRNIVEFKRICDDEYALLLEYVYFDFKPFGLRAKVNCLADLLLNLDKNSCANIDKQVFYRAASDVASGLQYLHESGITHRDLKSANILVSNQHYCQLTDPAKIEEISHKTPLICKLTDFGESRSQDIRTNTILYSKTNQVNRGTPVFMAPELLINIKMKQSVEKTTPTEQISSITSEVPITIDDSPDDSDTCQSDLNDFNKKFDFSKTSDSDISNDSLPPAFDKPTQSNSNLKHTPPPKLKSLSAIGQHYNGDESLPVYEWTTTIKCPAEILETLLKPIDDTLICKKVPTAIQHNACFLLDRSSLKNDNDWKCDDLEGFPRWIFIQYLFDGKEHSIEPMVHGNCKRKHSTPYNAYQDAQEEQGGAKYHSARDNSCNLHDVATFCTDPNNVVLHPVNNIVNKLFRVVQSSILFTTLFAPVVNNLHQHDDFYACKRGNLLCENLRTRLLDADDEDDLRAKLLSLKEVEMMNESMLKEARRNAGLGDPPIPYYTNIPESANALIKRGVNFRQNEIADFCHEMGILLSRQKEDVDSAVINKGPYRLAPAFSSFEVSQSDWFKMNTKQREAHLKRFHAKRMSNEANIDCIPSTGRDNTDDACSDVPPPAKLVQLSVDLGDESTSDKIAYMVESQTSKRPHYVDVSSKICSHAIAVAEKVGVTAKYLKWLREKGPARMNVTAMMTFDSSSGTGKKGGKAATARRKGGRTANQPEVTTIIDRSFYGNADGVFSNTTTLHGFPWTFTDGVCSNTTTLPPSVSFSGPSQFCSPM
ncbi:Tyrosine- kinase SPK-1, partial [Paramuricea clavata]